MKTLILFLLITVSSIGADLNNMTKAEYTEFNKEMYKEFKTDPQGAAEKAAQILIGMLGLEAKPDSHVVFRTDGVFTINSMLLLVATSNNIKREAAFIAEYKKEAAGVEAKLSGVGLTYHKVFTSALIAGAEKLQ